MTYATSIAPTNQEFSTISLIGKSDKNIFLKGLVEFYKSDISRKIYIKDIGYRNKLLIGLIDKVDIEGAECILNKEVLERI